MNYYSVCSTLLYSTMFIHYAILLVKAFIRIILNYLPFWCEQFFNSSQYSIGVTGLNKSPTICSSTAAGFKLLVSIIKDNRPGYNFFSRRSKISSLGRTKNSDRNRKDSIGWVYRKTFKNLMICGRGFMIWLQIAVKIAL